MIYESILLFISSSISIWLIRKYAIKLGLLDIPNSRSIHTKPTPRGAGIAFLFSLLLVTLIFYFKLFTLYIWTFFAICSIFIIGLIDDLISVSPKIKFIVIIFSTILLSFNDIIITDIGKFFTIDIELWWFSLPFTIFVVSGFTNALNLTDGLDGLSSSISIVILTAFFYLGTINSDIFMIYISGSFIVILMAFLLYNWYPASIFMGDSGSLTLGFVISILAIKSLAYIPAVTILYIGAIPILDTLVAMIRRKREGHSFFYADSCHLHHIVKEYFNDSTIKSVLFLSSIQMIYTFIGLQFSKGIDQGFLLLLFIINIILLYRFLDFILKKGKRKC